MFLFFIIISYDIYACFKIGEIEFKGSKHKENKDNYYNNHRDERQQKDE